ncbi:hypothetical protein [Haliangium sp.]|uniref:hypothetical protein n=1 Tax=Haliangium sp. TaxID=2663208 RepID=UPI003D0F5B52
MSIYVEDWHVEYGRPHRMEVDEDLEGGARLVEDDSELRFHPGKAPPLDQVRMACVDGVRRAEALLHARDDDTGAESWGVAGAFAWGSVMLDQGRRPWFEGCQVARVAIWGNDYHGVLPEVPGGFCWKPESIAEAEVSAPFSKLENLMGHAERKLAEDIAGRDFLTLVDGPLKFLRERPHPRIVGYIKTHHRQLLSAPEHRRVPELPVGWRTSLFALGEDRLSAYARIGPRSRVGSPWTGLVRLELFQSFGLDAARAEADRVTGILPRLAGIPHRDPRAPQNLQPVGALEHHLRRLMGTPGLANRAARDAVARAAAADAHHSPPPAVSAALDPAAVDDRAAGEMSAGGMSAGGVSG